MSLPSGRCNVGPEHQSDPTEVSTINIESALWSAPSQNSFTVFAAANSTNPDDCAADTGATSLTPLTKVEMPVVQIPEGHYVPLDGTLVEGALYEQQTMDAGSLAHLIGDYIDYLIEDNERITQISRAYTLPTPLDFEKEQYFHEVRNSDTRFPTTRFRAWLEVCHGNHIEIVAPIQQVGQQLHAGIVPAVMQQCDREMQHLSAGAATAPNSPGDNSFASSCTANEVS